MRKISLILVVFLAAAVFALVSEANAFVWVEWQHGDAGSLLDTAQVITGSGEVEAIQGRIRNYPGVDMYRLWLTGGETFSATVTSADFDTQLFLFDEEGFGIYANDNLAKGNLLSALPSGDMSPEEAGTYYLAISRYDRNPRNADGKIFKNLPRYTVHYADGPGADSPLASWSRDDDHYGSGGYYISLSGARGVIPEPATLSLLGLGLLGMLGLRKKKS